MILFFAILIVYCGMAFTIWFMGMPARVNYVLTLDAPQQHVEVHLTPHVNGTVDVKGIDAAYEETISIETFFKDRIWRPKTVIDEDFRTAMALAAIPPLLCAAMMANILWQRRKDAFLRRSLAAHSFETRTPKENRTLKRVRHGKRAQKKT